jgi:dihydrodipicolinate synthase/N-acetylneuraminate lyase
MSTPALALYQTPGNLPIVEYTRRRDRALSDSLTPARDAFEKWMRRPWLEDRVIPIAELKAWLELLGLPQGPVRPPLLPLSDERRRELARDLEQLGLR